MGPGGRWCDVACSGLVIDCGVLSRVRPLRISCPARQPLPRVLPGAPRDYYMVWCGSFELTPLAQLRLRLPVLCGFLARRAGLVVSIARFWGARLMHHMGAWEGPAIRYISWLMGSRRVRLRPGRVLRVACPALWVVSRPALQLDLGWPWRWGVRPPHAAQLIYSLLSSLSPPPAPAQGWGRTLPGLTHKGPLGFLRGGGVPELTRQLSPLA